MVVPCALLTINAERKLNRYARAAYVAEVRQHARILTLNYLRELDGQPFTGPVAVEFTPFQPKHVLADTANHLPTAKAVLDGIVDAKLIPDDTPEWVVSQMFYPPRRGPREGMMVEIIGVS